MSGIGSASTGICWWWVGAPGSSHLQVHEGKGIRLRWWWMNLQCIIIMHIYILEGRTGVLLHVWMSKYPLSRTAGNTTVGVEVHVELHVSRPVLLNFSSLGFIDGLCKGWSNWDLGARELEWVFGWWGWSDLWEDEVVWGGCGVILDQLTVQSMGLQNELATIAQTIVNI